MANDMSLTLDPDAPTIPFGIAAAESQAPSHASAARAKSEPASEAKSSFEFQIVSGTHRDATFLVGPDDLLVIGAEASCDICLSDAGVMPRHAAISLQNGCPSIRSLDGPLDVDDRTIAAAVRVPLQGDCVVTLGVSGVKLQLIGPGSARAVVTRPEVPATKGMGRRFWIFALVILVAGAAVTGLTGWENAAAPLSRPTREPDIAALQSMLQREGVSADVKVSSTSYGIVLNGVIDEAGAARLNSAVAKLQAPVINATVSSEELLEQVRDVFRVQGYEASVTYLGQRRVRVENLDEHNERVRQAATRARSDVPQLTELSFAEPGAAIPPEHAPVYQGRSAERLSVRIDGETAYLATTGGARYFEGSVLPSGHTVKRITPNAVQVERGGQIEWFSF
jgi:type III secretion protein D